MSYTPTVDSTDRYATVDISGERFTYPVSTATIAGVAAPIRGNNLLKASNNFSDSSWTKTRATISGTTLDVTLTSGEVVTMSKIVEDGTAAATHLVFQSDIPARADRPVVATMLIKQADAARNGIRLNVRSDTATSSIYGDFNAESGTVVGTGVAGAGVVSGSSITSVGGGVYLCVLRGTVSVTSGNLVDQFNVQLLDDANSIGYNGDSTSGVYIAQAQLTEGTEATTYQETSSQALTSPGDLSSSSWVKSESTISATTHNATLTTGRVLVMQKMLESDPTAEHRVYQETNLPGDSSATFVVKVKKSDVSRPYCRVALGNNAGSGFCRVDVNMDAGTLSAVTNAGLAASGAATIESLGDGVYKVTVSGVTTNVGGSTVRPNVYTMSTDGTTTAVDGNTSLGIYIAESLCHAAKVPQEYADEPRPRISGDGQRLTHSGDLSNAAHTKTRTTVSGTTHNATLDTGEVLTMQKVVQDGTAGATHFIFQNGDFLANTPGTFCVKVKLADAGFPYIRVGLSENSTGTNFAWARINLSTGVLDSAAGTLTVSDIDSLGDGVYLVTITGTPTVGAGNMRAQISLMSADGSSLTFNGDSASGCYAAEPILVAGSTAPSYTRSYADRLASGGSTRGRAYVLIPHIDDFDAAGIHVGTRWNTEQNWIITDGTDTATSTEQIAPPDVGAFDSVGVGPYEHAPEGVTPGDDGYMHLLTGSGTFTTSAFGFAPAENSTFRSMAYSIVDAEWLAGFDTSENFSAPPSPPDESLWVAVKQIVTNVVMEIT